VIRGPGPVILYWHWVIWYSFPAHLLVIGHRSLAQTPLGIFGDSLLVTPWPEGLCVGLTTFQIISNIVELVYLLIGISCEKCVQGAFIHCAWARLSRQQQEPHFRQDPSFWLGWPGLDLWAIQLIPSWQLWADHIAILIASFVGA